MRNKQLLTDKENERMFVDMVENVVGIPIDLRYTTKDTAYVESYKSYYVIMLGRIKGVDRFTLLNHEVGHILFNSPTKSGEDMIDEWVKEWKDKEHADLIKKTYWCALNLIEDQRIESLMSKLYLYNKKRFYRVKIHVGRGYNNHSLREKRVDWLVNPLLVLEFVRFLRNDIMICEHGSKATLDRGYCVCAGKECFSVVKNILNEVEGTGQNGALIGLVKFKPYLDEYITASIEKDEHDWEEDLISPDDTQSLYDEIGKINTSNIKNETFEDSRHDGERDMQEIKDKLFGIPDINKIVAHNVIEDDGDICIGLGIPNQKIVDGMSKVFRKLCEMPKETIGYDGDEIDIESYITNKAGNVCDLDYCFKDTKYVNGVSILISVDGSASMEDGHVSNTNSMACARDMVATMYKSLEGISNVNLKTIVWSSDLMGIMNITTVNSIEDTRKIRTAGDYPTTPTHLAIEYSTKMIKKMKGRKKLLIFITDGSPEYMKNGVNIPTNVLTKMGKNAMVRGLRRCNSIMVMLIKPSDYSKKCCDEIFGKRLMIVDNMKSGSDIIMNKFKRLVMGVLR